MERRGIEEQDWIDKETWKRGCDGQPTQLQRLMGNVHYASTLAWPAHVGLH